MVLLTNEFGNEYGIYDNSSGSITMVNSILWGNTQNADSANIVGDPTVTYSDIGWFAYQSTGFAGTGNIELDPLFIDAANVWGVDYSNSIDESSKVRSATGISIDWFTPIGPLNFSLATPLTKNSTDKTEGFRFNLGTTF